MPDTLTTVPSQMHTPATRSRRLWARLRTSLFWMVVIAFLLRFGWMVAAHTYKFRTSDQNFGFGWEMGRIGRSIAEGHGFSNPFDAATGPTAWEPPLYPYLIGYVFKILGVYTHASALVLLTINSIFSALTCIPIFLIAKRCFGEKVAVGSAWTWVLLPYVIYWCTHWVWETSLSALLVATIFWLSLTISERNGLRWWVILGLLWGISALNSPVLLAFLPASGLWSLYHSLKANKPAVRGAVVASVIFFACLSPWLYRNYTTFHQPVFLRSNFGAELRMGNGPGADGTWMWFLHPTQNLYALHQYENMGEVAYVAERKREAVDWIKQDPARFLGISAKKFVYYWAGVPKLSNFPPPEVKNALFLASSILCFWGLFRAIRQRRPGAWLFFWLILCYPLVYYVVFPHARYRHPIDPEIGILGVFLICEAEKRPRVAAKPTA